ncbi:unnamed protein product [Hymenolepis diminuta]|uniref:Uncharacterized protein n=1 Tax=Hymenolepis diminuta TaxID=6216 RepID=A0A564Y8G5_HYMDI|nr:unnamed protein product [Hymenolepis diminuta]
MTEARIDRYLVRTVMSIEFLVKVCSRIFPFFLKFELNNGFLMICTLFNFFCI